MSAVRSEQTGRHHLRGGSLEGARRLGGSSGSSLSVTVVAVMGGGEIQMVDGEQSRVGAVEAIDEAPSTEAQPSANTLDPVIDTLSFNHS